MAAAAEQILAAIQPLEKDLGKATGAKKGAITKHIHRVVDALLTGDEIDADDEELARTSTRRTSPRRASSATACSRTSSDTWEEGQDIRELTNDLCLRTDGKIQKEDLDRRSSGR